MKRTFIAIVCAATLLTCISQFVAAQGANQLSGESDADNSTMDTTSNRKIAPAPRAGQEKPTIHAPGAKDKSGGATTTGRRE